jgi:hypothetical protein
MIILQIDRYLHDYIPQQICYNAVMQSMQVWQTSGVGWRVKIHAPFYIKASWQKLYFDHFVYIDVE